MPEPRTNSNEPASAVVKREIRWDAVAAVIASLVGLLALIVAGYTAYIQRYTAQLQKEQVEAQVWPYLLPGVDMGNEPYGMVITNKGVGPAIVRSVQVSVDGKAAVNWSAVNQLLGFNPSDGFGNSFLNHNVLSPGERLRWITFDNRTDAREFERDLVKFHTRILVCYSSALGESWVMTMAPGAKLRQQVPECPAVPTSTQFAD